MLNYLSLTNFATQKFYPSSRVAIAAGQIGGYPDDRTADDFAFDIDSGDGSVMHERYYARESAGASACASAASDDRPALAIDVELVLQEPGYLPTTPTGVEEEGYSRDGLYNPETMYGLSYYYYAPAMALTGTITAGERPGVSQGRPGSSTSGGTSRPPIPKPTAGAGGASRFDDGGGINWRQWERGPDNAPVYHLNHFAIHTADGRVSYG